VSLVTVRSLDLGPSFTHFSVPTSSLSAGQNETIRSHPVPSNLANYRDHYRSCAEDLFLTYKTLQSHNPLVPLLITIPGSLYDSDFDFLMSLLVRFKPHHVIHLGDFQESDTDVATKLHALQTAASQYRGAVHEITSHVPSYPSMRTESELRAMQMQSYFHLRSANMNGENPSTWSAAPMTKHVPWEFCFEETEERMQDFAGFAMYSEPIEAISLVHALNGSVVQIVQSTSSTVPACYTSLPRTNRHRIPYFPKSGRTGIVEPLDPRTSQLICTALVRGFDAARKVVQLLIPKTHENLLYTLSPERTIFVGGCCDTPDWAFVEEVHATAVVERDGSRCALGAPWVQDGFLVDNMGYLDTVRRVRKFQT
jgi:polynucleotide 5'-hydroxyl-kinase GRC3/NOL9